MTATAARIRGAALARRVGSDAPAPPGETARAALIPTRAGSRRSLPVSTSARRWGGATTAHEQEGPSEERGGRQREQERDVRLRDRRPGAVPAECEDIDRMCVA